MEQERFIQLLDTLEILVPLEKLEILDQKELLGPKDPKEKQVVQLDRMDLLEK
jgi:hypothetical protein